MKLTNKELAWGAGRTFNTRWKPGELWRLLCARRERRLAQEAKRKEEKRA